MKKFIKKFAEQLLDQEHQNISAETIFRKLDEWDSLTAMAVLAMIEDEYGVKIDYDFFTKFVTIQDVYDFVMSHK